MELCLGCGLRLPALCNAKFCVRLYINCTSPLPTGVTICMNTYTTKFDCRAGADLEGPLRGSQGVRVLVPEESCSQTVAEQVLKLCSLTSEGGIQTPLYPMETLSQLAGYLLQLRHKEVIEHLGMESIHSGVMSSPEAQMLKSHKFSYNNYIECGKNVMLKIHTCNG